MDLNNKIVNLAREQIGTRFKHQGRVFKTKEGRGGCDCFGLIIEISRRLQIKSTNGKYLYLYDFKNYPRLPDESLLLDFCNNHLIKVDQYEQGNLLLFKFNNKAQHIGLYSNSQNKETLIHSYVQTKSIVEQTLNSYWLDKIHSIYKFKL